MKTLVLGADGMLGHRVVQTLLGAGHDVVAATRRPPHSKSLASLSGARVLSGIDVRLSDTIHIALAESRPDAVINGVGIVKQRPEAKQPMESIRVNSLFPHELSNLCRAVGARLIHLSTDCVFSGTGGRYTENDLPDPVDLYGRSKLLGEVTAPGCLTLRTSIIGLELFRSDSLIEWFLRQTGVISGWTRVPYSGLTTSELARVIAELLVANPELDGLWHVASEPISKYDLLVMLKHTIGHEIEIVADDSVRIDRTLDASRFGTETGYRPPDWTTMLSELASEVRKRSAVVRV